MKRVRAGIWGLSEVAQRIIIPLFQGGEMLAPPDMGSRWERRPGALFDYQPSAIAMLVAIGDEDVARLERIGQVCAAQTPFTHWSDMLRESKLDTLWLTKPPKEPLGEVIKVMAEKGTRWLWLHFPPATTSDATLALLAQAKMQGIDVHWAQPVILLRAHRAAKRMLLHDDIGVVQHVHLAWPLPFITPTENDSRWWETVRAFNLALSIAGTREVASATRILQITAGKCGDSVSVWAKCANDVTVSLHFGAPLPTSPRLEINLSKGNTLVCESGNHLVHYTSRTASRAYSVSGQEVEDNGTLSGAYAEDIKRFLADCGRHNASLSRLSRGVPENDAVGETQWWRAAANALQAMEGAEDALRTRALELLPPLHTDHLSSRTREQIAPLKTTSAVLPFK